MTAAERVCAEVREAFELGAMDDWHAEHLSDCADCSTGVETALPFAAAAAPALVAARLDAGLEEVLTPRPAAPGPLPRVWIAILLLGALVAYLSGLRHPQPETDRRDPWRARPHSALSPTELPTEIFLDPRGGARGVSE